MRAAMTPLRHMAVIVTLFLAAATPILAARLHAAPPPVRPADCSLGKAVHQLAQNMYVRVGFENLPGCTPGPRQQDRPNLTNALPSPSATAPDALDRLLINAPEFSWRSVGDMFVIRPTAAWRDATDPLNFRTTPFSVQRLDLDAALQTLIQHVEPAIYIPNTVVRRRVGSITLSFPGGTLLEARRIWRTGSMGSRVDGCRHGRCAEPRP